MQVSIRPWSRFLPKGPASHETHYLSARDGVRLAVHRVRPPGAVAGPPVMLLHGLGANSHGWLMPQRSLAHWLAERGWDVFVPELRGAGESGAAGGRWDLDDYLDADLPAILDAVRDASGQSEVSWVGHSMGGLLLCCYAMRRPDHGIARGVCVGSALDYTVGRSGFARLLPLRPLLARLGRVPFGLTAHLVSPLLGRVRSPLEAFNFHHANVEPEVIRQIHAHAFGWIPVSLLLSLATTFEPGGLRSRDGKMRYLECATECRLPLLLLSGSADVQCPPEAVEETARRIGGNARVLHLGRAHGTQEEYGHFDLLVGRHAPEEVWPRIAAFLEGRDAVRPSR